MGKGEFLTLTDDEWMSLYRIIKDPTASMQKRLDAVITLTKDMTNEIKKETSSEAICLNQTSELWNQ